MWKLLILVYNCVKKKKFQTKLQKKKENINAYWTQFPNL